VQAIRDGSGFFQHGHTYLGHPVACAAALAVQRVIRDEGLLARVMSLGNQLDQMLRERLAHHPNVGDIRGRGLFRGIELVADCNTQKPLDPMLRIHAKIKVAAMARGLLCYPMGGTIDGEQGDHILLAPPFTLTVDQVEELADGVAAAIQDILPVVV
jgi:adenosylmethionine-8-amino-7-oxononanoate aminotransferase